MSAETTQFPRSGSLASGSYEQETEELAIEFSSGSTYVYHDVPVTVWRALQVAPSAGQFFHRMIRDRYSYEQV